MLETDKTVQDRIILSIKKKFELIPNIGHLQVWLQRMTLKYRPEEEYDEPLCKLVAGKHEIIWNKDWLKGNIKAIFDTTPIVDNDAIEKMSSIPAPTEIKVFDKY